MKRDLTILGSTGSIGRQTVEVALEQGISVRALTGGKNIDLMEQQVRLLRPSLVAMADPEAAAELAQRLFGSGVPVLSGEEGICKAAELDTETVLSAIVGAAGIRPTVTAIARGARIGLANKEVLVAAGSVVLPMVEQYGAELLPVDSEHSAIFQCLMAKGGGGAPRRILLTASGGPFFGKTREQLAAVTVEQALKHPSWRMGAKITVDSATLMNKGYEVIEAAWLFGLPIDRIEVLIHRQSIVHSMVEFEDGSVMAQLGRTDMKIPIQLALTYPQRASLPLSPLDFTQQPPHTVAAPDRETFGCLALCEQAFAVGGTAPAALNAAGETAVYAFLSGRLPFLAIEQLCREVLAAHAPIPSPSLEQILAVDAAVRAEAEERLSAFSF
ncbi:MAG: 1-deoxy-D-xylulose-5-phosphate reductoisomerase [Clostridia bacterium]|nr:1-deoxy-D-xylulose-5-phosphate reductoisomerase [Clostridia bacterium]